MKHDDPLAKLDEVRRRLGAPRVNISVLWVVVTQLASDLTWALSELDSLKRYVRTIQDSLDGPDPTYYVAPVGGSDPIAPALDHKVVQPSLFDAP